MSNNEFGKWVCAMRRYCGVSLGDMANDFCTKPHVLRDLELSRDGRVYTERQKKLIKAYFRIVCKEKGLDFGAVKTQHDKDKELEKCEKKAQKDVGIYEMKSLYDIFGGIFGGEGIDSIRRTNGSR